MKWYEQRFVNRRDWVLDHLEFLGLTSDEIVLILLIDFMNEHGMVPDKIVLARKTGKTEDEVERIISILCMKNYLAIKAEGSNIHWDLSGLFSTDVARAASIVDSSLMDTFESEFGRPLSEKEMEKISDWSRSIDKKLILYALREASAQGKVDIRYIDRILHDWKSNKRTVEAIENRIRGEKA